MYNKKTKIQNTNKREEKIQRWERGSKLIESKLIENDSLLLNKSIIYSEWKNNNDEKCYREKNINNTL